MLPAIPVSPVFSASTPERVAVTSTSAQFSTTMVSGCTYELTSSARAWIKIAANPTAEADTTGNLLIAPDTPTRIAAQGSANKVAIIRDTADGDATLARIGAVT